MKISLIAVILSVALTSPTLVVKADTQTNAGNYLEPYRTSSISPSEEEAKKKANEILTKVQEEKEAKIKAQKEEEERLKNEQLKASQEIPTTDTGGTSIVGSTVYTPIQFINLITPKVQVISSKYNMWTSLAIANAMQESANGNSELAKGGNNLFGIKAYSDWAGDTIGNAPANEDGGNSVSYRSYKTIEESIEDFYKLMQNNRYTSIREASNVYDALKFYETGYAGDNTKDAQLKSLIEQYNLTQYDNAPQSNTVTNTITDQNTNRITKERVSKEEMKELIIQQVIKEVGTQ
ncbi:glucosaminidase domain-containing protein [Clostridium tertium]|uniref:glucosaminidase domain-containing protein n=1 Tax=Clostridium tertium TaxID=1559 RepID=UPI0023B34B6F|nr:glucosaminidase domain-containing protein [Clostridium tertium]